MARRDTILTPQGHRYEISLPHGFQVHGDPRGVVLQGALGQVVVPWHRWVPHGTMAWRVQDTPAPEEQPAVAEHTGATPPPRQLVLVGQDRHEVGRVGRLVARAVASTQRGVHLDVRVHRLVARFRVVGRRVYLNLGYSHDLVFQLPPGVAATVQGPSHLILFGVDWPQVTETAARLRRLRPPSRYGGRGVHVGQVVATTAPTRRQ